MFTPHVQETPAPPLTLESAVQEALTRNPAAQAARKDVAAAALAVRSARALANPDITFAPALDQFQGTTEELMISQPLEINGARSARTKGAEARARAALATAMTQIREIVADTRVAYITLWRERELLALSRTVLENAETLDRLARKQVELGSRAGVDLAQTGLEVTRARQQVTQAQGRVRQAEASLNRSLGRDATTPAPEVALPAAEAFPAVADTVLAAALTSRSEIIEQEALRESLRQEGALARAEGRLDIAPQFRSQYVTFQRPTRSDYGFSVAVRLPLIDWGSRKNRIQQAETAASAQSDRIEAARQQVRQEVTQALSRLQAAGEVETSFAEALPQAERLLRASRIGFEEGKTTILAVLEAQRAYRATLSDYAAARAERSLARAEFERAIGSLSPSLLSIPTGGTPK